MTQITNEGQLQVIATQSARVKDLVIKDGQLIFIQDMKRIALDFKGIRTFYNQITELDTDLERTSIASPSYGYYFVIDTAVLWLYKDAWIRVTQDPSGIVFVDANVPALGQANKLYVDKTKKQISVWDDAIKQYIVVADTSTSSSGSITDEEINSLFK